MKNIKQIFKEQIADFHNVALDVITLKNVIQPKGLVVLSISFLTAMKLSDLLFVIFVAFYLLDFFSGSIASRIEDKEKGIESVYWVKSDKIMRGIIKFVVYLQIIILSMVAQKMIVNPEFVIHSSLMPLSLIQITLCVCITSEFVSNLENAKRSHFDLIGGLQGFIKTIWKIIRNIKTGKEE